MLVIARDLGQKIDRNDAFKGTDGKYYSSEEAFKKLIAKKILDSAEKEARAKCVDKMYDFMGYKSTDKMSSVFFGRLKVWNDKWGYNYSEVLEAMNFVTDTIDYISRTKVFQSDTSRLFYYMGVVQNALNDGRREYQRKQKAIEEANKTVVPVSNEDIKVGVIKRKGKTVMINGLE